MLLRKAMGKKIKNLQKTDMVAVDLQYILSRASAFPDLQSHMPMHYITNTVSMDYH